MKRRTLGRLRWAAAILVLAPPSAAQATWSIVMADSETKEVAVGTVTCLTSYDLLALVPVMVVGKGGAAVQASGDFDGIRRPVIFDALMDGTPPDVILGMLSHIPGHQSRQYGIADINGEMITFTGGSTSPWTGGLIGSQGTLVYAVQGNVLAGECVILAIEQALRQTDGDIPAKLMAGMQAAREMGGDGRCSCSWGNPPSCGCPVEDFDKSGHIGTMVISRIGDTDDPACNANGCADGDYFMRFNVPFQNNKDRDPVIQLQLMFDAWRQDLEGRPDAIRSTATFDPAPIPPNGTASTTMTIALFDWRGEVIDAVIESLTVTHAPESDGISSIGEINDNGDGSFSVAITAGTDAGTDRFTVTADDGIRPVVLMPDPTLQYFSYGDMNCDGALDTGDVEPFATALVDPAGYAANFPECSRELADLTGDGVPDGLDIDAFVTALLQP